MLFVSAEDFFKKAEQARRLSREEEKALALAMKQDKVMTLPLKRLVAITKEFAKSKR